MRSEHAAQQIVRGADVGDPVAHRLVDSILQCARARIHAAHLGPEQAHAENVELLPPHVFGSHVDYALESEQRADSCGSNAMLTSPGFCDNAALAHALGKQCLSQAIVNFVRASVEQVFALQIYLGSAE